MTDFGNSFFISACAQSPTGGIYRYQVDGDGQWIMDGFHQLDGGNYICFSADRTRLYSTLNDQKGGGVAAFCVEKDLSLKLLNSLPSEGMACCHLSCTPDGHFLISVNYSSGNLTVYSLNPDGSLGKRIALIQHHGSGPRKDRQECAHTHCVRMTPDKTHAAIVDLGVDKIFFYPLDPVQGIVDTPVVFEAEPGDGPRHILFDRAGTHAYIVNELGNSVTACRYLGAGKLEVLGKYSTLPDGCDAVTKAAAVRFSPDEKYLYASNRGFDSIACYRIVKPGELERIEIVDAHGVSPRDINFLPGGVFFAAANEFSDNLSLYRQDPATGKLLYLEGHDLKGLPRPLCIEY